MSNVPRGFLALYHRTTTEAARAILATGRFESKEQGYVFFSNRASSDYADGYGTAVVRVVVREDAAELDDEFQDGEEHYRVHSRNIPREAISLVE